MTPVPSLKLSAHAGEEDSSIITGGLPGAGSGREPSANLLNGTWFHSIRLMMSRAISLSPAALFLLTLSEYLIGSYHFTKAETSAKSPSYLFGIRQKSAGLGERCEQV